MCDLDQQKIFEQVVDSFIIDAQSSSVHSEPPPSIEKSKPINKTKSRQPYDPMNPPQKKKRESKCKALLIESQYHDTLPEGWRKVVVQRTTGTTAGKFDVYYLTPSGRKLRSKNEIKEFAGKHGIVVDVMSFGFARPRKDKPKNERNSKIKKKKELMAPVEVKKPVIEVSKPNVQVNVTKPAAVQVNIKPPIQLNFKPAIQVSTKPAVKVNVKPVQVNINPPTNSTIVQATSNSNIQEININNIYTLANSDNLVIQNIGGGSAIANINGTEQLCIIEGISLPHIQTFTTIPHLDQNQTIAIVEDVTLPITPEAPEITEVKVELPETEQITEQVEQMEESSNTIVKEEEMDFDIDQSQVGKPFRIERPISFSCF